MKKISTTKISLQSSNPKFSYPLIRLPREYKELVGQIASVCQAEIGGVRGFFIAPQLDKLDKSDEKAENPILSLIPQTETKNKRPSRDLNPSRSLDRAP